MELIVQPDDGAAPLLAAIKRAKAQIDLVIFRFDVSDLERALEAAVLRGVVVRALIAHTNKNGEKKLRKLEDRLLSYGVTVDRTGSDLVRYHGKLLVIDSRLVFVLGFNYTHLDIRKSRSFGVRTSNRKFVQEVLQMITADANRQTFTSSHPDLVVSPETARQRLTRFIEKARTELLIYDPGVSDDAMIRVLKARAKAGVRIRILGKLEKKWRGEDLAAEDLPDKRIHVRAIIRDGRHAFVGSQSLRKLELDKRREVGIIFREPKTVKRLVATFEADWALTKSGGKADHIDSPNTPSPNT